MTGSVVAFPGPYLDHRTRGLAVVVAPHAGATTAWVQTARGWRILERSPDCEHVVDDGRRYARRFGLPLRLQRHPLGSEPEAAATATSEIYVWPCADGGGSWGVECVSGHGDSSALIATAFSFTEAVTIARTEARRLGAAFDEPGPSAA